MMITPACNHDPYRGQANYDRSDFDHHGHFQGHPGYGHHYPRRRNLSAIIPLLFLVAGLIVLLIWLFSITPPLPDAPTIPDAAGETI